MKKTLIVDVEREADKNDKHNDSQKKKIVAHNRDPLAAAPSKARMDRLAKKRE